MLKKIQFILTENFPWISKDEIKPDSKIREGLGLDSVSLINLQILIEDNFNIQFNPIEDDLSIIFHDIESLLKFIREKNV